MLQLEILIALAGFSLVSSITPGPNNLMLLASGTNYGFVRSLPHMFGISGGFAILLLCVGFGLGEILEASPTLYLGLKIAGATYLIYLAWKIANSGPIASGKIDGRPMRFIEAAAFQWVNPKAWVMALGSMTAYTNPSTYMLSVVIVAAVFTLVNLPSIAVWCGMGLWLRQFLADPLRLRIFNITMAVLLVASLWPMLR
jgi:threonine/homoserine/homoserine lactone efflux protein